ncbi:large subunit ribosomal protein L41, partial [Tremellales sp. Uapishka_1]
MQFSRALFGASRLPLTPKRGNKDFYKGTGQSYVPGGGHRTGPPGKFVVKGKAKYRLLDERVRYFVGPGEEAFSNSNAHLAPFLQLKPYVSSAAKHHDSPIRSLPSFSPNFTSHESRKTFTKRYQTLDYESRQALIMDTRKKWWNGLIDVLGKKEGVAEKEAEEERQTRELETKATS